MFHFYQGPERLRDADDFIMVDDISDSQVDFIIAVSVNWVRLHGVDLIGDGVVSLVAWICQSAV